MDRLAGENDRSWVAEIPRVKPRKYLKDMILRPSRQRSTCGEHLYVQSGFEEAGIRWFGAQALTAGN
jgi:hypothetical protein